MYNTELAGAAASACSPMPPGFYNMDCIEAMKKFPNKFFDLAIVDPPYGGGSICSKDDTPPPPKKFRAAERPAGSAESEDDSGEHLTAIISVTRTGGTWASKYRERRMAA